MTQNHLYYLGKYFLNWLLKSVEFVVFYAGCRKIIRTETIENITNIF